MLAALRSSARHFAFKKLAVSPCFLSLSYSILRGQHLPPRSSGLQGGSKNSFNMQSLPRGLKNPILLLLPTCHLVNCCPVSQFFEEKGYRVVLQTSSMWLWSIPGDLATADSALSNRKNLKPRWIRANNHTQASFSQSMVRLSSMLTVTWSTINWNSFCLWHVSFLSSLAAWLAKHKRYSSILPTWNQSLVRWTRSVSAN